MNKNKYIHLKNDITKLIINSPKYGIKEFMIDTEDYLKISKFHWWAAVDKTKKYFVAMATIKKIKPRKVITLSRFIMNYPKGKIVDHKNHDKFNNCKKNLRVCTSMQNSQNSKCRINSKVKFKGVWIRNDKPRIKKFVSEIIFSKKKIFLGNWKTAKEAALSYNCAARILFGEFACENKI